MNPMPSFEQRYRLQVIAGWRVGCIARDLEDRAEYVGRHHKR
ncbi:hypothetical protein ACFOY2_04850 [Nonomuraea purpurea]|uniref:Uncharacterized protein n=1 Tax=Nonomuraea purpurea TaxID=1849276 RepID=A0ABV8G2E0_9ACTN